MFKDFDKWNSLKQKIDLRELNNFLVREREIWWCNLGLNIGDEENGKNKNFERPVLIVKKFNNRICIVIPLSSRSGNGKFYKRIKYSNKNSFVIISQIRIVSTKRLTRKIGYLEYKQFKIIKDLLITILK